MVDIPQNCLFRFRMPCKRLRDGFKRAPIAPEALSEEYSLPIWSRCDIADPSEAVSFATNNVRARKSGDEALFDIRFGWLMEGIAFTVVLAKRENPRAWERSQLDRADSLRLCLDTRDVKDSHRASQFCHKIYFYPFVGGSVETARPIALWTPLERAKSAPEPVDVDEFSLASAMLDDRTVFSGFIPRATLTGFAPEEFGRLGVHFEYRDSENGAFVLQFSEPLPVENDPSLWATLEMTGAGSEG